MKNELRKDYILDRWVIIASERAKRPTDFRVRRKGRVKTKTCPFCPGNERMTPPAFLLYLPSNGKDFKRGKDRNGERPTNWLVRCVPNLYPALSPRKPVSLDEEDIFHRRRDGVGKHEVIIESPHHNEHPGKARLRQTRLLVQVYIDRLKSLSRWEYVSIFRNHGKEAGASLSHAHSQIIATPMVPKRILDELDACATLFKKNEVCPFCQIIETERDSPRFIYENQSFIAIAPWASVYPFEFWLIPKKHQHTLLQMRKNEKEDFAKALKTCFAGLTKILKDPPYSYGFHIAPNKEGYEFFHWHLEVYPKLSIHAGFENSNDMFINVTPPEIAAESLRNTLKSK